MDREDLEWMRQQARYRSHYVNASGGYSVWMWEDEVDGALHPYPFSCINDYTQWVSHK